ncbi:MAG: hypothetical protein V3S30_08150 [Thermoanaerobaculia bacterium]
MSKRRCHFARIRYRPDFTAMESFPAFEVILWTHPEVVIEVTKADPFPELPDDISREMAEDIAPVAMTFIEQMVARGMAPPLIMARLGREIMGTFYVSGIGEEIRKTRDSAA